MIIICTDEAPAGVPAPTTMLTDVALSHTGAVTAVPELGSAPTLALNEALMKLAPYTVMVLPAYATDGATEVDKGCPNILRIVGTSIVGPYAYDNCTDVSPILVLCWIYTATEDELIQYAPLCIPNLAIGPTLAVKCVLKKLVPYTVI